MAGCKKSLREVFDEASELPTGSKRQAYLEGACGGDPTLRANAEELLKSLDEAGGFLADSKRNSTRVDLQPTEQPGQSIGRYKLLQKIGEGGCGVVFMAEQSEPVRRLVAVKVIKPGLETESVIARFEAERQVLALMDHPSIAKILDAGTTGNGEVGRQNSEGHANACFPGRPYFVMELVRGTKITEYCERNQLPTTERLRLFIRVCQAVQHAHQKGIIHRDLKPSNILVADQDGVPIPKVIDFGIAKATADIQLTDKTLFTRFDLFLGTPAYMSPEQAGFNTSDIDTRTDIYSLGVLLYELLTGQPPFDGRELLSGGLDGMRKIIREKEPLRPSTRLSQTLASADAEQTQSTAVGSPSAGEAISNSSGRLTRIRDTITLLRGDLDWIVLKALEKDRNRRYDTANGFATDIQRHLSNEPVLARPPSTAYKIQKTWQRNRIAFAATAGVILAMAAGISISTWQALVATRAGRAAQIAQQAAESARNRESALRQREKVQTRQARLLAYSSDMKLADQSLSDNHLGRTRESLDRHRPLPGEEDLRGWEWRYLWQRSRSAELFTLLREAGDEILDVSFSPDGRFLTTRPGHGRSFQLFEVTTRSPVTHDALAGKWHSMAFSPRSRLLACSGTDAKGQELLNVVSLPDLKLLNSIRLDFEMDRLLFSGDGRYLIGADRQSQLLKLWDMQEQKFVEQFPDFLEQSGIGKGIKAVSPDGQWLAVGTTTGFLRLCKLPGQLIEPQIKASEENIAAVAFSPNSRWVASSSSFTDARVRVWEVATGREIAQLKGHGAYVQCLEFLADGTTLVSGSSDQTIRFWDVPTQRELAVLRGHESEVRCLSYSSATGLLASGGKDGQLKFWRGSPEQAREAWTQLPARLERVERFSSGSLAWTPDSAILATFEKSDQGTGLIQFWDAKRLERLPESFPLDQVRAMIFSPDGRELILGTRDGQVHSYNRNTRLLTERTFDLGDDLFTIKPVNEGSQILIIGSSSLARVDAKSWRILQRIPLSAMELSSAEINPAGTRLLRGEWGEGRGNGDLESVDLQSGKSIRTPRPFAGSIVSGLAFLPDGRHAAIVNGSARPIVLWDTATQTQLREVRGHLLAGHGAGQSSDGQRLITGSTYPESAKIWDMRLSSLREVLNLSALGSIFQSVGFSPDGSTVFAIERRGAAYFWRAPSWEEIAAAEAGENKVSRQPN